MSSAPSAKARHTSRPFRSIDRLDVGAGGVSGGQLVVRGGSGAARARARGPRGRPRSAGGRARRPRRRILALARLGVHGVSGAQRRPRPSRAGSGRRPTLRRGRSRVPRRDRSRRLRRRGSRCEGETGPPIQYGKAVLLARDAGRFAWRSQAHRLPLPTVSAICGDPASPVPSRAPPRLAFAMGSPAASPNRAADGNLALHEPFALGAGPAPALEGARPRRGRADDRRARALGDRPSPRLRPHARRREVRPPRLVALGGRHRLRALQPRASPRPGEPGVARARPLRPLQGPRGPDPVRGARPPRLLPARGPSGPAQDRRARFRATPT